MARPKRDLTKVTVNMNTNVLEILDKYAEDNNISRTTAMMLLLTWQLDKQGYGKGEE